MPATLSLAGRIGDLTRRRFRFGVSLCVLATLFWFLSGALERQAGRAGEAAERVMLNQLRAALVIKTAEIGLARQSNFADWLGINPMLLLETPPPAYDGPCRDPLRPGHWCFRTTGPGPHGPVGVLRYRVTTAVPQNETGNNVQNWTVVLEYNDRNGNDRQDNEDRVTGLKLSSSPKRTPNETEPMPGGQP